jgi:tripartite-type tricarboxylate transporter receptor subunit TctC
MHTPKSLFISGLAALALTPQLGWSQAYPSKPIRLIVPFAAGGPADIFARPFAQELSTQLGQPVVVDNRTGVGGVSGVDAVAKAPADGYTIGFAGAAALATAQFMIPSMPFDIQKDLALVTLAIRVPEVIVVGSKVGVKTLPELVSRAKAKPGELHFGSAGTGSITHLAGELLKKEANIEMTHVPYRGAAPAVNDLLGGQVQVVVADVPVLLPHIKAGSIVPLAVTSGARAVSLPQVPTTAELGLPKVISDNWYGIVAPARTPPDILKKIHAASIAALKAPTVVDVYAKQSANSSPTTPEQFGTFVRDEQAKWLPIIRATGAKME